MDQVNKSKALNILIPKLIDKSNTLSKEINSRMKLNKIFEEFDNKASNNLNYFITASNQRYINSKLGNDLDSILSSTRAKNINEAKKIINDKFYKDSILETERQKMKYKSTSKIYKEIKETFNLMKLPLETKFSPNSKREINNIIKGYDKNAQKPKLLDESKIDEPKKIEYNFEENVKKDKNAISYELEKENNSINRTIAKYMNNMERLKFIDNFDLSNPATTPRPPKKYNFDLPNIKLLNYKKYKMPRRILSTEDDKKPNIKKLLPYSKLFKNNNNVKKNEESPNNEKDSKNFPFITETNIKVFKNYDYHNTLNVVYNSANNEFQLQNTFDNKRRKLDNMLGINKIPQISTYDDIAYKKSQSIKNKRHKKAKKLSESQRYEILSRKEKFNMVIDRDLSLLDDLENKIYKNINMNHKDMQSKD